jgi:hypothetical protein
MRPIAALVATALFTLASTLPSFGQAPQLLAKDPGNAAEKPHPVRLSKAEVHLLIAGRLSQTTMTLTFANDADRVLEGELVFPLPENATVSGYALDVGGQLVDAVTIEKEKARVVFETEVRGGIDPGIVEQVQGNNFRTRVHPIPAKGTRTIRVRYVSEPAAQGDQLLYRLPVGWPGASPELDVQIESVSTQAPRVEAIPDLAFQGDGTRFVAQRRLEKASFDKDVVAALPATAAPAVLVQKRTQSPVSAENLDPRAAEQLAKVERYFVLDNTPPVEPANARRQPTERPSRIAIAWDASLSRAKVDHAKEFDLIRRHLARLGDVTVDVIAFRNVPDAPRTFAVKGGDASEIIAHLSSIVYDGGTNLSAVEFKKSTGGAIAHWLLFTDGLSNLGPELPATVEAPVYAVAVDPRSNHNLLRRLSTTSGGQYVNMESLSVDQAVTALSESPLSLISIDHDEKEVADLYPRLPQPVQGRVTIAGRLLAPSAKITLNYGRDGRIISRVPLTLTREAAREGGLVPRFWAQLKLADLSIAADRNEAEITDLGKRFDLVTPYTSMIVLETVEQYLRHKIVPPKSRGDVYAQFMQRIEQQQAVARNEEKAKIDRVVAMWNQRLAWWNQDFKYPADFKYRPPADGKKPAAAVDLNGATIAGVPAASAPRVAEPSPQPSERPASNAPAPAGGEVRRRAMEEPRQQQDALIRESDVDRAARADQGGGGGGGGGLFGGGRGFAASGARGPAAAQDTEALASRGEAFYARDGSTLGRAVTTQPFGEAGRGRVGGKPEGTPAATIDIKPWTPDVPYLKALQAAPADRAYSIYLEQRQSYESSPAFYLDCADFFAKPSPDLALRILTNIPELAIDDGRLLRIAAHRLQQLGRLDLAIDLFEKVSRLRPEEPQSFRDLALALADRADAAAANNDSSRARSDYGRALQLLHKVVMNTWQRFDGIEVIALTEANRLLARAESIGNPQSAIRNPFDPRLVKLLDPDLRIVLTWDTDNTDIDLHVLEPSGEECLYSHNRTTIGGAMSTDFTQGYGPEEYMLRRLMPGEYKIRAHFFGNRDQRLVGPTTVQATLITHYGRPDEKRQAITLRLKDAKEMVDVGTVTLK